MDNKNSNRLQEFVDNNIWLTLLSVSVTIAIAIYAILTSWYDHKTTLLEQQISVLASGHEQQISILEKTLQQKESITGDTIAGLQNQLNKINTQLGYSIGTVTVESALYGRDILKKHTNWFAARCNGKIECVFNVNLDHALGDHEPYKEKGLKLRYRCHDDGGVKKFTLDPFKEPHEALIRLSCVVEK
jgi:hypothetical protein